MVQKYTNPLKNRYGIITLVSRSGSFLRVLPLAALLCTPLLMSPAAFAQKGKPKNPPVAASKPVASVSPSGDAKRDIDAAEQLLTKAEYEDVSMLLEAVLKKGGLAHADLLRATKTLAIARAYLDDEPGAEEAFVRLLTYAPDTQVDTDFGPKVTTPFYAARGFWRGQSQKAGLELTPVVSLTEAGQLKVVLRDPTRIAKKTVVGDRWGMTGEFRKSNIPEGPNGAVEIAPPPKDVRRLDYFAQTLDEKGNVVFEVGSPDAPKTYVLTGSTGTVTAEKSGGGVFSSPVFWIVAGAVLIGGGIGGYFLLRPQDPTSATATIGLVCGIGPTGERCR